MGTTLIDDAGAGRFELRIDGVPVVIEDYTLEDGVISFNHTEALDGFEGTGAARQLAERILDEARRRGLQVLPVCTYIVVVHRQTPRGLPRPRAHRPPCRVRPLSRIGPPPGPT